MEKRKYELSKYADMHSEKDVVGKDGISVTVADHISYEEKENMANEMVQHTLTLYNDSIAYENTGYDKVLKYMVAKYYTSVDVDDEDMYDVADFMINNNLWDSVCEYVSDDMAVVLEIYNALLESVIVTYNDDKSLKTAIRTSFAFLFNGEDITETLARAEAAKDSVYKAVEAMRKMEKEQEGKLDNGKMDLGGKVINFAKKDNT